MVTRWPSCRKIRAQRKAATVLPARVLRPRGVTRTIFMLPPVSERPTSGAAPSELTSQLRQTRARTHRLVDELSSEQLMGLKLDIVNPVLWEIGHVGWFHEYWTLRLSHGQAPLIARADDLWNSSTVAHDTRRTHTLPDRENIFASVLDVWEGQCDHLPRHIFPAHAHYFNERAIGHEYMHVEALAYMGETLPFPPPTGRGKSAPP